ncbi:PREDICTED: probable E3 ubiquitin-protein ligase RHG1A [Camelina sativa]|uniref:RING-type E3 ubiquitin transferase n=1 Tax=Camelina sativa TaxID=90675 RepID=A0ABM0YAL6_CAMSA|nr:PREDICTED: probable E3 ubiquitin-protein ligase RHG1A [Camelina sativa]
MSSTTIGVHTRLRRARNQTIRHLEAAEDDPPLSHVVLPISQPNIFCNSAMSSFFLLPASSSSNSNETAKKKPYQTASFRGMGCTAAAAAQQVSVPSVIRSSADWDARIRKDKKKQTKKNKSKKNSYEDGSIRILSEARDVVAGGCVSVPDVWCGPGLGFSTDAVVDRSVDPPRRRNLPSSRRKIDVDNNIFNHNTEGSSVLLTSSRAEPTLLSSRCRSQLQRSYPDDLTEMMMLQNGFVMGKITDLRDHYHELRLDVDNMSYEQLLELGDRIGYVNTGLKESEIHRCLGKIKPSISHTLADRKCSICQDEYEREDEVGKLNCEHSFHVHCVKQWLSRKNACPVCKKTAYFKS